QTAGLVLVDPSHPDQLSRSRELRKSMQNFRNFFHVASAASHFGVMRVTDLLSSMTEGLSGSERARARVFFVSGRHLKSAARELDAWKGTAEQTRAVRFGNLPLLILSAPEPQVQWVKEFQKMHEEMLSLSTSSTHRTVPGAEHLNIVTRQENALHVSRGILEVVDEVRRR